VAYLSSRTEFFSLELVLSLHFCWRSWSLQWLFEFVSAEKKVLASSPNTSIIVSNDCSQHLYCVSSIMQCAIGVHLHVGLAERLTPCRFVWTQLILRWNSARFSSLVLGKKAIFPVKTLRMIIWYKRACVRQTRDNFLCRRKFFKKDVNEHVVIKQNQSGNLYSKSNCVTAWSCLSMRLQLQIWNLAA